MVFLKALVLNFSDRVINLEKLKIKVFNKLESYKQLGDLML